MVYAIVSAVGMSLCGLESLVLVHEVKYISHRVRVGIIPFCVIVCEFILKGGKTNLISSAEHEGSKKFY